MNGKEMLTHSSENDKKHVNVGAPHWNPNEGETVAQGSGCPVMGHQRTAVDEIFEDEGFYKPKGGASGIFEEPLKPNMIKYKAAAGGSIDEQILKVIAQIYTAVKNNDVTTLTRLIERDGSDFDIFEFRDA